MTGLLFAGLPVDNFSLRASQIPAVGSFYHLDPSRIEKPPGQLNILGFLAINNAYIYLTATTCFSAFIYIFFPDREPLDPDRN